MVFLGAILVISATLFAHASTTPTPSTGSNTTSLTYSPDDTTTFWNATLEQTSNGSSTLSTVLPMGYWVDCYSEGAALTEILAWMNVFVAISVEGVKPYDGTLTQGQSWPASGDSFITLSRPFGRGLPRAIFILALAETLVWANKPGKTLDRYFEWESHILKDARLQAEITVKRRRGTQQGSSDNLALPSSSSFLPHPSIASRSEDSALTNSTTDPIDTFLTEALSNTTTSTGVNRDTTYSIPLSDIVVELRYEPGSKLTHNLRGIFLAFLRPTVVATTQDFMDPVPMGTAFIVPEYNVGIIVQSFRRPSSTTPPDGAFLNRHLYSAVYKALKQLLAAMEPEPGALPRPDALVPDFVAEVYAKEVLLGRMVIQTATRSTTQLEGIKVS